MNLEDAVIIGHAREQLARRGITDDDIAGVLRDPEAVHPVRTGRVVAQRLAEFGDPPKAYLLRVFVDIDCEPPEVVTAYRTSKIDKYRSSP